MKPSDPATKIDILDMRSDLCIILAALGVLTHGEVSKALMLRSEERAQECLKILEEMQSHETA